MLDAHVGRHRRGLERLRLEEGKQEEREKGESFGQDELNVGGNKVSLRPNIRSAMVNECAPDPVARRERSCAGSSSES